MIFFKLIIKYYNKIINMKFVLCSIIYWTIFDEIIRSNFQTNDIVLKTILCLINTITNITLLLIRFFIDIDTITLTYYLAVGFYIYDLNLKNINLKNINLYTIHHILTIIGLYYMFDSNDNVYIQLGFLYAEISNIFLYIVYIYENLYIFETHFTYICLLIFEFLLYSLFRCVFPIIIINKIENFIPKTIAFTIYIASIIWTIGMAKKLYITIISTY